MQNTKDSLSKTKLNNLKWIFIESKRYRNNILSWSDNKKSRQIKDFDTKNINIVYLKNNKVKTDYTTRLLSAQVRQSIQQEMLDNIKALSVLKKNGRQKPGKLKYKSDCTSINFKQFGNTWKLIDAHHIRLQCIGMLRVNGLKQIYYNKDAEYANAKLLKKGSDYYFHIIVYVPREKGVKPSTNAIIGIDMGCSDNFVLSTGVKVNALIEEPERLKRLQRKLSKQVKGSNSYWVTRLQIQDYYQHMSNIKKDKTNKLAAEWFATYAKIIIQDEQLHPWAKGGHGRVIQHSILGRMKSLLKERGEMSERVVVLPKLYPTTKLCSNCGQYHDDLKVWDRVFECDCGVREDRNVHAAKNMVFLYEQLVGVGCPDLKRAELEPLLAGVCENGGTASKWLAVKHESAA